MKRWNSASGVIALSTSFALCWQVGVAFAQEDEQAVALPTLELRSFLGSIDTPERAAPMAWQRFGTQTVPRDSIFYEFVTREGNLEQPLRTTEELLILVDPTASADAVKSAIAESDIEVLGAEPEIGLLRVRVPTVAVPGAGVLREPDQIVETEVIRRLKENEVFIEVTPNTVLTPFQTFQSANATVGAVGGAAIAAGVGPAAANEVTDWGATDAKTTHLWSLLAERPVLVGIIDVGFDDHEDLVMVKGLNQVLTAHDHGNHVTGIACARHNGIGLKGTAANCTARVAIGSFVLPLIDPIESDGPLGFHTLFAELVSTVLDFVGQNPDVRVINLSLGYNWMPNFNINPEAPGAAGIRDMVRGQGRIMLSILEYARRSGVIIVSAAGNDSSSLGNDPLSARWASPFNWAAAAMRENLGWSNGLVVEAHDRQGRRAGFSNNEGTVSAPGVDIYSALAGGFSRYGKMSGTSMASPLVAGGVAVLRALNPDLTLEQIYRCVVDTAAHNATGAARVNFESSANACKP